MPDTIANIKQLEELELEQYCGNLEALNGKREQYEKLMNSSVRVSVVAERGVCDDVVYDICIQLAGNYSAFELLRRRATFILSRNFEAPNWNRLAVLFTGIYIGDPENVRNLRIGRKEGILYQIRGLGEKLADVTFDGGR